MKSLVLLTILFTCFGVHSSSLTAENEQNQEKLVLQDLEQIQNHGKKWHSKLKKATTAIKPIAGRQAQNEG
ncbi:MAG TPA: hypothetical protein VKY27_02055 [Bacteriovoracaceae bacterium]|nr:hypothetical protein [Bacteriovoracaceae bacterium]